MAAELAEINGPFKKHNSTPAQFAEFRLHFGYGRWQDFEVSEESARYMLTRLQAIFPSEDKG